MSWDIYIQDLPPVKSVRELPADLQLKPIGIRAELERKITEAVGHTEKQDGWLFVKGSGIDISISFQMETPELVRYITVHVHGGEQSAACVAAIVKHLGLRALDTATGEFLDTDALEESL